jgi:hypothetical protein
MTAEDIRVFRLQGAQPFSQAMEAVDECLRLALAEGATRVLLDVRGLTGFRSPDLSARVAMVRRWAEASQCRFRLAVLCPPGFVDRERFGVVVARGLGLDGDVFDHEDDALGWLRQAAVPPARR